MKTQYDLFGEKVIIDRRTAGMVAQESGKLFESQTEDEFKKHNMVYVKAPKFHCHYGLNRRGDFKIYLNNNREVHIECKQLGDVHSHFDKLDHCLLNVISGCYGNHFWLIYDYNKNISFSRKDKILKLIERCKKIKEMVALQGITFELIYMDDLKYYLKKLKGGVNT